VANVAKWFGDQAFSYLVTVFVPGGPWSDAVLSPLKDILCELIGSYSATILVGGSFDPDSNAIMKSMHGAVENVINEMMGEMFDKSITELNIKKLGLIITGIFVFNWTKHWLYDPKPGEPRDAYKALCDSVSDFGVGVVKAYFGKKLEGKLKTWVDEGKLSGFVKYIQEKAGVDLSSLTDPQKFERFGLNLEGMVDGKASTALNTLNKYIVEAFGEGVGLFFETAPDGKFLSTAQEKIDKLNGAVTFTVAPGVSIALSATSGALAVMEAIYLQIADWIWGAPAPKLLTPPPADPKLYPPGEVTTIQDSNGFDPSKY